MDVEQLPDGSILVSDDAAGSVYRISYSAPTSCRAAKSNTIRKRETEEEDDGEDANLAPAGERSSREIIKLCIVHGPSCWRFGEVGHPARAPCSPPDQAITAQPPPPLPSPAALPGTANGCRVNQGLYGAPLYRRCYHADVSKGAGRKVQLATSLVNVGGTLVLRGALLLPKFACTASAAGWVGFGLPKEQGSGDMKGANVFITRPAPATDLGAFGKGREEREIIRDAPKRAACSQFGYSCLAAACCCPLPQARWPPTTIWLPHPWLASRPPLASSRTRPA